MKALDDESYLIMYYYPANLEMPWVGWNWGLYLNMSAVKKMTFQNRIENLPADLANACDRLLTDSILVCLKTFFFSFLFY